jgi:hypothetical protein
MKFKKKYALRDGCWFKPWERLLCIWCFNNKGNLEAATREKAAVKSKTRVVDKELQIDVPYQISAAWVVRGDGREAREADTWGGVREVEGRCIGDGGWSWMVYLRAEKVVVLKIKEKK